MTRRGLSSLGETNRGDLIIHVNVVIPTKLKDDERQLIEQFGERHDGDKPKVEQSSKPLSAKKGFFSKLKDALG